MATVADRRYSAKANCKCYKASAAETGVKKIPLPGNQASARINPRTNGTKEGQRSMNEF
jgi:hypothetical protein